ncbi:hypothetical protein RB595_003716 [Gaeumannomyces hyphopodioides]
MRCTPRAVWSLAGAAACLGSMADAAGVFDVGLVFPRANETYEPAEEFPFVWALQNARSAGLLQPEFGFRLVNQSNRSAEALAVDVFQRHLNLSDFADKESGLVLFWTHVRLDGEGPVGMLWSAHWLECKAKPPGRPDDRSDTSVNRSSTFAVDFSLKKGGKKADLVAATAANAGECPDRGFALRVTDKTEDVRSFNYPDSRCAVVDSSSPTPPANPCRVKIDEAVVASMEATAFKTKCSMTWGKPDNCPKEDHAMRQFATAGTAALSAAFGALYFAVA